MTPTPEPSRGVPSWTVGDRLRKARIHAHVSAAEMAALIFRNVKTISNYETGAVEHVPRLVVQRWAERCGVPESWLLYGTVESSPGGSPNRTEQGVTIRYPAVTQLRRAA